MKDRENEAYWLGVMDGMARDIRRQIDVLTEMAHLEDIDVFYVFDNKGRRRFSRLTSEERGGGRRATSRGKKAK